MTGLLGDDAAVAAVPTPARLRVEPVPAAAPGPLAPGPLATPGILLTMVDPPAPEPVWQLPRRPRGGVAASAAGAAGALLVLTAQAVDRQLLPLGERGDIAWLSAVGSLFVGYGIGRAAPPTPAGAALPGVLAALALAGTAVAVAFVGERAALVALLLAAFAQGALLVLAWPVGHWRTVVLAAVGAAIAGGAAAAVRVPLPWLPLLFAALSLQVYCLLAAAYRLRRRPFGPGAARRPWHLLLAVAVVALAAWLVPRLLARPWPAAPFWLATALPIVLATALVRASVPLLLALAALGAMAAMWPPVAEFGGGRWLAGSGPQRVGYLPRNQELQLHDGDRLVAAVGPDRVEGPLAAVLLQAFSRPGDRVLVLGPGQGPVRAAIEQLADVAVDAVDRRPSPIGSWLRAVGAVLPPDPAAEPRVRAAAFAPMLRRMAAGSRQAIVVAEPPPVEPTVAEATFQAELARVVGEGLLVQQLWLDHGDAAAIDRLLAAAAAVHPWNGLFVVGDAALLLSAGRCPEFAAVPPLPTWPVALRWLAHQAHLGEVDDLRRIWLGTLRAAAAASPRNPAVTPAEAAAAAEPRGRAAAIAVLHRWLEPSPEPPRSAGSLFCRWRSQQAELRAAVQRLAALPASPAGRAEAQQLAARFLPVGAPLAPLQAALGLAAEDGSELVPPAVASRRAHALDPSFLAAPPPVFAGLPMPNQRCGELEDLAVLPPPARLAELCSGDSPLAVALRARFPSACAAALVAALALAPLPPAQVESLRELADPVVLAEAGQVLAGRRAARELLGLWRADLPVPAAVAGLCRGGVEDRRALAKALAGRTERSCLPVLAELLEDAELEPRQLAAAALRQLPGHAIPYDPAGSESARQAAARQVRSLHNRAP